MKIGDRVPKEDYVYYVVQSLNNEEKQKNEYTKVHKIGDKIIAMKKDLTRDVGGYEQSFRDFLKDYCRLATEEEKNEMYEDEFSNARVLDVYDDGSYTICFYYVPIKDLKLEEYIMKIDWWEKSLAKSKIFENMGMEFENYEIDDDGNFIYKRFHKGTDKILKYCRKTTLEETETFNKSLAHQQQMKREKYLEEQRIKEQERLERYNKHKNDANYYPGSCGNYNQVLVDTKGIPETSKLYDLYTIRQFYNELICSRKIDQQLLEQIMVYGGTVPYILFNTKEDTRKFGDVDIFVPVENMEKFRDTLFDKRYFAMKFDSMDLTRKAGLTIKGQHINVPLFMGDADDMESYNAYQGMLSEYMEEAQSHLVYQDYGFKGTLFGIPISVFPIYQWNKDNKLDICAKSFRVGREEGDAKYLLNTIVTHNTPITSFSKLVEMYGGKIGIANLEYTIASKESAIQHGYLLRQESDLKDLEFIRRNKGLFHIDDDLVQHYEENIPDYGIAKVYRITRSYKVSELTPEEYRNVVTRNDKPS